MIKFILNGCGLPRLSAGKSRNDGERMKIKNFISTLGKEKALEIIKNYGGQYVYLSIFGLKEKGNKIYIPTIYSFEMYKKRENILLAFSDSNRSIKEIAKQNDVTVSCVYKILNKIKK